MEHGNKGHGHELDQGWRGALRYLRFARSMWRSELNQAVVEMVAPTRGETVVDVGAGMGAATIPASKTGAAVVAVEPTPFLRSVLKFRTLAPGRNKTISIVDAAVEALPLEDESVDAIWSVNTMHHWVDQASGVNEIARVLHKDGRLVLVDEDFTDPQHPEFDKWTTRHHHHEHSEDDPSDDGHADHDNADHDGEHHLHSDHDDHDAHSHGFTMVEADEMAQLFGSHGWVVKAEKRTLVGRPCVIVTANI